MQHRENIKLDSPAGRPFLLDVYWKYTGAEKPVLIFCHGFKGFKDWGPWEEVAWQFADKGLVFIKFNFSHNGTTPENPTEFVDLEAFGHNNYSRELMDLERVIDWVKETDAIPEMAIDREAIYLLGHSRGGGIALVRAAEDKRVKGLVSWSSVASLDRFGTEEYIPTWREQGVQWVRNRRTGQKLPLYYQIYEDFDAQRNRFNLEARAEQLQKPWLIVHSKDDDTVPFSAAQALKSRADQAILLPVENSNHVFGGSHPWERVALPEALERVVDRSADFIQTAERGEQ